MSRARWRIAYLLDRSSRLCWTNLVCWALSEEGNTPFPSSASCRAESLTHRDLTCYCGKFRNGQTGCKSSATSLGGAQ